MPQPLPRTIAKSGLADKKNFPGGILVTISCIFYTFYGGCWAPSVNFTCVRTPLAARNSQPWTSSLAEPVTRDSLWGIRKRLIIEGMRGTRHLHYISESHTPGELRQRRVTKCILFSHARRAARRKHSLLSPAERSAWLVMGKTIFRLGTHTHAFSHKTRPN